jgi:hypothetical protein
MKNPTKKVYDAIEEQYPLLGIALNHHRTTRGQPLSFADKPYLIELYCDAPKIDGFDAMKAVQIGWSELLIQLCLERARIGRIAAYILPTYQLRDRFVQRRIQPPLEQVAYYRQFLDEGNRGSLRIKRFGKGSLLFLGSNTVNDFIEFSADVMVVDEFDRCVEQNLALARDRLRASPNPQLFRIGNPMQAKRGVAALYDNSDGRRWFHKCGRCGEKQPLEWQVNFVTRDVNGRWMLRARKGASSGHIRPVCRSCGKPFERVAEGGQWVAERPSKNRRGYNPTRLDVLSQDIRGLWLEWLEAQNDTYKIQAFYASVLGRPYEAEGSAVTAKMLADASTGSPMDYGGSAELKDQTVVAGIDVGSEELHMTISTVQENQDESMVRTLVWTGTLRTFDEVYDALVRYRVNSAVCDSRPEMRKAQELRDKCANVGNVDLWLCQFHPTGKVGSEAYGMRKNYVTKMVTVDRTQLLDATMDDLRSDPRRRIFCEDVWSVAGWADQMQAPKRVPNQTGDRVLWDSGNAADHYRFADAYERVATDLISSGGRYISMEVRPNG